VPEELGLLPSDHITCTYGLNSQFNQALIVGHIENDATPAFFKRGLNICIHLDVQRPRWLWRVRIGVHYANDLDMGFPGKYIKECSPAVACPEN